ncbi:MAG: hypothetical protein COV59_02140 [Candidatus Magasanikbacteria bacterium CG11_big_fil_rev_8_21_14_0_20_39_34]|uniref:Uncharacterized protein n=1 Tax=Candidatus Magasanikbacteria bacterium CG11_big_fil_rev_8_21_14_0_20_39_34 TaxID=1974653 RepID=A0A2H0N4Z8_9BACT|nr:MAG: hypothetical protein COV59_02140 [Candidatus Magasanikbacteria bacterium CG11_big_fil_rev_8_21_14_0_20_39_34]
METPPKKCFGRNFPNISQILAMPELLVRLMLYEISLFFFGLSPNCFKKFSNFHFLLKTIL